MTRSRFPIDGMTCSHCEQTVREALSSIVGVTDVQVSASESIATVMHDHRLSADQVAAAVTEAGYAVRV